MQPFQQRVVDEKKELDDKVAKLCEFIDKSPTYRSLPADERSRLTEQLAVMRQYSCILGLRIAAFK